MADRNQPNVTGLLIDWSKGDERALAELIPLVYDELRRVARSHLRRERPGHTLQSTALVHEAFLRLIDQSKIQWHGRAHFFAVAANMIRRILVDHARARLTAKRGSGGLKLSLDEAIGIPGAQDTDLVKLDDCLTALARIDEQQSRIVELRFFAGLSIEETAAVVGVSPATVKRDWVMAKAWLYRNMVGSPQSKGTPV